MSYVFTKEFRYILANIFNLADLVIVNGKLINNFVSAVSPAYNAIWDIVNSNLGNLTFLGLSFE